MFYFVHLGYIGHRKFGVLASPEVIRRAEEQARGVPKSLAFNLLNILVDLKTQASSNISGQNGKKALDKNILGAIQCKFSKHMYLNLLPTGILKNNLDHHIQNLMWGYRMHVLHWASYEMFVITREKLYRIVLYWLIIRKTVDLNKSHLL